MQFWKLEVVLTGSPERVDGFRGLMTSSGFVFLGYLEANTESWLATSRASSAPTYLDALLRSMALGRVEFTLTHSLEDPRSVKA